MIVHFLKVHRLNVHNMLINVGMNQMQQIFHPAEADCVLIIQYLQQMKNVLSFKRDVELMAKDV